MNAKPLITLWSKAALAAAGDSLNPIQRLVRLECGEISNDAMGWFMHLVQLEGGQPYICTGSDEGEAWQVRVQLGEFEAMDPLPENHPDPQSRGGVVKIPRASDADDNDVFVEVGYLEH